MQSSEDPNPQPLQHTPLRKPLWRGRPAPPRRSRVRPPKCVAPPRAAAAATTADHRPTRRRRAPPGRGGAARARGGAWRSTGHRGDGSSGCGGEVAVAAEGVGGAFGYLGGLAEGAAALAPMVGEVAGAMAATATAGLAVGLAGGAAYGLSRAARTRLCRTSGPPTT